MSLQISDLKVGETYVSIHEKQFLRTVLFVGDRTILYHSKYDNLDHMSTLDHFLRENTIPEKPKTKWYRVSFKLKSAKRPEHCLEMYLNKEDFLLNRCAGRSEDDFNFINMELVYEE